ncbi:MAG: N-acetylmuramic acid 6-phosphate etherase [Alphaproteobacteria bacterium]
MTSTEGASPKYRNFDAWPTRDVVSALVEANWRAVAAVHSKTEEFAGVIDAATERLQSSKNSRIIYAGAGTSGRLASLDVAELFPTYSWSRDRSLSLEADCDPEFLAGVSAAEDSTELAERLFRATKVCSTDVVVGIAASGNTPYTKKMLELAKDVGALTIAISNNEGGTILDAAEYSLVFSTGEEVLPGSTRLVSGTAQKIFLNTFSTAVMTKLGRVVNGRMVCMDPGNKKLHERAISIIADVTNSSKVVAADLFGRSRNSIPHALLMSRGLSFDQADDVLVENDGAVKQPYLDLSQQEGSAG